MAMGDAMSDLYRSCPNPCSVCNLETDWHGNCENIHCVNHRSHHFYDPVRKVYVGRDEYDHAQRSARERMEGLLNR